MTFSRELGQIILTFIWNHSVMSNSLWSQGLQPSRLLHPWDFPGKNIRVGCQLPSPGDLPNPGIKPRSPALQVDSLPPEPPGNPCIEPQKTPKSQSDNDILHEIKSISYENFKWNIIYKNIKLLCYTHETNNNIVNQLYFDFLIK